MDGVRGMRVRARLGFWGGFAVRESGVRESASYGVLLA
jgi:hypothetical protein